MTNPTATDVDSARRRTTPAAWLLTQPIRFYQKFITPYTPATCRYYPTCSEYAVRSLRTHGAIKGTILTVWRLLRCNPWSSGGVDHTPERGQWRSPASTTVSTERAMNSDPGTDTASETVSSVRVADVTSGFAGNDVIPVVSRTHTCGNANCDADETAQPAVCAPNAGRAAA